MDDIILTSSDAFVPIDDDLETFAFDPAKHPRHPSGAEASKGGEFAPSDGHAALSDAPDSKGMAEWRRKAQKLYDSDEKFRAVVDAIGYFTQGSYKVVRAFSEAVITGKLDPMWDDSAVPGWFDKPMSASAMGKYKSFFAGQNLDLYGKNPAHSRATWREAAQALNDAIDNARPLPEPIWRGVYGRDALDVLAKLKKGDTFPLYGATSFTSDKFIAAQFAEHRARGQRGGGLSNYVPKAIIEIEQGAKGLKVSAMSPWKQKEVLSSGQFEVVEALNSDSGFYSGIKIIKLRQVKTWKNKT